MRILLVEDDPKISAAIKRGLEQESFAIDVEHDSDDGLAAALAGSYDAIILDRMLPGSMEGLGIAEELRSQNFAVPILILTAKDKIPDRVGGLNAGADDYLVKPFAFEELVARLRALLRRPPQSLESVLRVKDLELDTTSYQVSRSGKPIQLSSKEFALLEYMMRHPGQILSKDTLIEHVWDFDADVLPNNVEVYMGYLRTKIDRPFRKKGLIHTVRGFGYRLGDA